MDLDGFSVIFSNGGNNLLSIGRYVANKAAFIGAYKYTATRLMTPCLTSRDMALSTAERDLSFKNGDW
jgi:hypothetical protein